jgi:spore coat polysaccharide biosynthesis protein SpsF (cytidylyltransferase family)
LLDPKVLDEVVELFNARDCDYASNIQPPTFPHGLDVEVCSWAALRKAWREATSDEEREHVTWYLRIRPDQFRLANLEHRPDLSGMRWVLDRPEDLVFIREVYQQLGERPFGMVEVLALLRAAPKLARLAEVGRELPAPLQASTGRDDG